MSMLDEKQQIVLDAVIRLGVRGGVAILMGVVAVWWIEPTTEGGVVFTVAIVFIGVITIGGVLSHTLRRKITSTHAIQVTRPPVPPRVHIARGRTGGRRWWP